MKNKYIYGISMLLVFLVVSMPFCFAQEMQLTYDANGNLVTGDGKYRTYNSLNQLWRVYNGSNTSILLEEYTYHPLEERVVMKKVYNTTGALVETTYYINQNYVQVVNANGAVHNYTYYYLQGQLVGQDGINGSQTYYHTDIKGDIVKVTRGRGLVIENKKYSPTGEVLSGTGVSRYSYEGKEYDDVSGQTDFNARMYNAPTGQFIQPDTIISDLYNPQSLNRYSFEENSPYNRVDPSGHIIGLIIAFIVIALVITAVNVVLKDFENKNPSCQTTPSTPSKTTSSPKATNAKTDSNKKTDVSNIVSGGVKVATPEVLNGANSATSKASSEALSRATGAKITQGAVETAGEHANILLTIGFALKDTEESLDIINKYSDEQFNRQFPNYLTQIFSGKSGVLNEQCSDNTNLVTDATEQSTITVVMDNKDSSNIKVTYT